MPNTNRHDPAFTLSNAGEIASYGLTKREFFACHLLSGMLASQSVFWIEDDLVKSAEKAVAQADALINALNVKVVDCVKVRAS